MKKQPWIGTITQDLLLIVSPPFLCLFLIVLFPSITTSAKNISDIWWVILILLIDVAHVYSTLFRTYFDKTVFKKQQQLLFAIPFIGFVMGVILYAISPLLFWRVLAYVAIFHFIRQQYGFMRVYSRNENFSKYEQLIDSISIYTATIGPILFWHLQGKKNFNWFLENDLYYFQIPRLYFLLQIVYVAVIITYITKELRLLYLKAYFNWPKFLIIAGSFLSWYFGIVHYNGDLVFTLLNVVSHGIPYMALIWIYGKKRYTNNNKVGRVLKKVFNKYGLLLFLLIIFILAILEEWLWDWLVWKDHKVIFGSLGSVSIEDKWLNFLVPILALPQITHYILDGFIWRVGKGDFKWKSD
jgi:hypothetical protein